MYLIQYVKGNTILKFQISTGGNGKMTEKKPQKTLSKFSTLNIFFLDVPSLEGVTFDIRSTCLKVADAAGSSLSLFYALC